MSRRVKKAAQQLRRVIKTQLDRVVCNDHASQLLTSDLYDDRDDLLSVETIVDMYDDEVDIVGVNVCIAAKF